MRFWDQRNILETCIYYIQREKSIQQKKNQPQTETL